MTDETLDPQTSALFRLGVRWQAAGQWPAARVAFQRVLRVDREHALSRHNLAVCDLREGLYEPALSRLADLDRALTQGPDAKPPLAYSVEYNAAVVRLYLAEEPGHGTERQYAADAATKLALEILDARSTADEDPARETLDRLEGPVLVLCASTWLVAGRAGRRQLGEAPSDASSVAQLLRRNDGWANSAIEDYVRTEWGDSARARYNLACYLSRLIDFTGDDINLLGPALGDLAFALEEPSLRALALTDRALNRLREAAGDRWDRVLRTAPPASVDDERARRPPEEMRS